MCLGLCFGLCFGFGPRLIVTLTFAFSARSAPGLGLCAMILPFFAFE
jgi:hypothetical protein